MSKGPGPVEEFINAMLCMAVLIVIAITVIGFIAGVFEAFHDIGRISDAMERISPPPVEQSE